MVYTVSVMYKLPNKIHKINVLHGFTLIELLIVIAILGILAVVVLVVVNPVERQAQARDSGRISTVTQLGHALQAYYTSGNALYPPEADWAQDLLDSGNLSSFPAGIAYTAYGIQPCTEFAQPAVDSTFCYAFDTLNGALVYSTLESENKNALCGSGESSYFVFSTADGRAGSICLNGEPVPWAAGTQTYVGN